MFATLQTENRWTFHSHACVGDKYGIVFQKTGFENFGQNRIRFKFTVFLKVDLDSKIAFLTLNNFRATFEYNFSEYRI